MKDIRSGFLVTVATVALIVGTGSAVSQGNSQNSNRMQSKDNGATSTNGQTQTGKMGETEQAGPQKSQKAHSGKMNAPKSGE